jgi:hypothetical protein
MANQEIPWSWNENSSTGGIIQEFAPPPPGYVLKLRGIYISMAPVATVTGSGSLSLGGIAATPSGPINSGAIYTNAVVYYQPSTTSAVNVPVDFGSEGVTIPGATTLVVSSGGSTGNVNVMLWGSLVPIN